MTVCTETHFTLQQLALISGLTDRTLRNHIAAGLLTGEKTDGQWFFTAEQTESYLSHPAVRPSILAKQNAILYNFLADERKKTDEVCVTADFPAASRFDICNFFCREISEGSYENIRFAYDGFGHTERVILRGRMQDVLTILNKFTALQAK